MVDLQLVMVASISLFLSILFWARDFPVFRRHKYHDVVPPSTIEEDTAGIDFL